MSTSNVSTKSIRFLGELASSYKIFLLITILLIIVMYAGDVFSQGQFIRIVDGDGIEIITAQATNQKGTQYLDVEDTLKVFRTLDERDNIARFNPKKKYIPLTGRLTLYIKGKSISLVLSKKIVDASDAKTYNLSKPPVVILDKPMLPVEFFTEVLSYVLEIGISYNRTTSTYNRTTSTLQLRLSEGGKEESPQILPVSGEEFILLLDPGNGGSDVGVKSSTGLLEKNLTLEIAKETQKLCMENGINIYLTRESDQFLTPIQRATAANMKRGSLFISIHFNASFSPHHSGFRIYINNPAGSLRYTDIPPGDSLQSGQLIKEIAQSDFLEQSRTLAKIIFDELELAGFAGIPPIEIPLITLNKVYIPAVLLSCGYLSNSSDVARFSEPKSIRVMAQTLFEATLKVKEHYHNKAEGNK